MAIANKSTHLGLRVVRWCLFALVCRRRDHKKPLGLLRQTLLALAGAVSKVLDGLFHAEGHVGELIEVIGQVAGKALLLRSACYELLFGRLRAGCGANAIDDGTHLARAAFIFGLGVLGMVAADVVAYPKRVVAGRGKLP